MWSLVSCKSLPVTRDAFSTTTQLHYCDVKGKEGPAEAASNTGFILPSFCSKPSFQIVIQEVWLSGNVVTVLSWSHFPR